jgi:3-dehydroquinate synthase
MKTIQVRVSSGAYTVNIGADYKLIGHRLRELGCSGKVSIVSDTNVFPIYGGDLSDSLEKKGFEVHYTILDAGEEYKTLSTVESLYKAFHLQGLTRSDTILALGGGVVGDITGFAAGTYLRGIPYVQVPTTLLAQIDSSVGGKTGVDTGDGKNLVGMFNQPMDVLIDPAFLDTLSLSIRADGMAEAIKYGLIRDDGLYKRILRGIDQDEMETLIYDCVSIKNAIVAQDEFDQGERMILNFGHTIGHAVEKCGNYNLYTHGQAVAIGMVYAAAIGEKLQITPAGTKDRIVQVLQKNGLPTETTLTPEQIFEALGSDKKKSGSHIQFILLERVGKAVIVPIETYKLKELLQFM